MWAHYGDSHQGAVIGIDIEEASLADENYSVIPAQYGEVVYSATKPKNLFDFSIEELIDIVYETSYFESNFYNIFKRAFLYKSHEWSYEEEVRIVKNIHNPFMKKNQLLVNLIISLDNGIKFLIRILVVRYIV